MKAKQLTENQAIKNAKKEYEYEYGKRAYNARISSFPRYGGGNYILINCNGNVIEYNY